jgi:hypothetical protein
MESITEIYDLKPNRQCSSCKAIRDELMFKDTKKEQYVKTCEMCRNSKHNYRNKKKSEGAAEAIVLATVEEEETESSIKSTSSSSS